VPAVSFLCEVHGWTVDYVLGLPIRTFFAFHREARHREIRRFSEFADLLMLARDDTNRKAYEWVKDRYRALIDPDGATKLPEKPGGPVIESGTQDATDLMKLVMGRKRAFLGYG